MPLSPFGLTLCPEIQPIFECWALNSTSLNSADLTPVQQRHAEEKLAPLFRRHGFPGIKGDEATLAIRAIRTELGIRHAR